jgi:hypothetical protein
MATVCSILNELGNAVVGVVRTEDYDLVRDMVRNILSSRPLA